MRIKAYLPAVLLILANGFFVNQAIAGETGPDLIWYDVAFSSSPGTEWVVGGNVTLQITVKNQGTAVVNNVFWTQLFLSRDTKLDEDGDGVQESGEDTFLQPSIQCGSIPILPDSSRIMEKTFIVPDVPDGLYYIGAWVDYEDDVDEDVDGFAVLENNNKGFVTVSGGPFLVTITHDRPDLVWTNLDLSTSDWVTGAQVTATLTVTNQGRVTASSHKSRLYLSTDQTIDASDTPLGSNPILFSQIDALGNQAITQTFTVSGAIPDGDYYVGARVDVDDEVDESDETNNGEGPVVPIKVRSGQPDLVWTSLQFSTMNWVVGTQVTATVTVRNQGSAQAVAHQTRLYLSSDAMVDTINDTALGVAPIAFGALAAGASQTLTQTFTVPNTPEGTYYAGVAVDVENNVTESSEDNNSGVASQTVQVSQYKADLLWTSLSISKNQWTVGENITAVLTEKNQGEVTAGSHTTRLYLSTDQIIETSDTPLGTDISYTSILAGATQSQNRTFAVPNVPGGTYYIGAIVDAGNSVTESDEDNNARALGTSITVVNNQADLIWTSLTPSTTNWVVGNQVTVNLTVQNQGQTPAGAHQTRLYLSADTTIETTDTPLGAAILSFNAIAVGATQTVNQTFTVPDLLSGTYYIGAIVDAGNSVIESNEDNNKKAKTTQPITVVNNQADLVWTTLSFSTTDWVVGSQVTANLTVKNQGFTTAGTHQTQLFLSSNATIGDTDDISLGATPISFGILTADASQTISQTFTVPDTLQAGTYYTGVRVDVNSSVSEGAGEANNSGVSTQSIQVIRYLADLTGTALQVSPSQVTVNGSVTVVLTEKNQGQIASGNHSTNLYFSTDTLIDALNDPVLGTLSFGTILAGKSQSKTQSLTVPNAPAGTYYIGAILDANQNIDETDEENNQLIGPIVTVQNNQPDLIWTSLTVSKTQWTVGESITVNLSEKNQGPTTAASHATRLYLSNNATLGDADDTPLGTAPISFSALSSGASQTLDQPVTVPNITTGTYYIGAVVDVNGVVSESNEANNSKVSTQTIEIRSPMPDLILSNLNFSSTYWVVDSPISDTLTVLNQGSSTAGSFSARLYLSKDAAFSSDDIALGSSAIAFSTIAAGASQQKIQTFNVPSLNDGTYYVFSQIDVANQVAELNESNNFGQFLNSITVRHGWPDLVGFNIQSSTDLWIPGSSIALTLTVHNQGTETANAHSSRFYLSTDEQIDQSDIPLGNGPLGFFTITSSGNATNTLRIIVPDVPDGNYYVGAFIDINGTVTESDETNNTATPVKKVTIQKGDYPDLFPSELSLSSTEWMPGSSITATVVEKNQGNATAVSHATRFYLSTDETITQTDRALGTTQISFPSIAAGASVEKNQTFTVPSDLATGKYYVGVISDILFQCDESDELNNVSVQAIPIEVGTQVASIRALAANTASTGSSFWVQIKVGDPTPVQNLFALSFNLTYNNASNLNYVTARAGNFFGRDTLFLATNDAQQGVVSFSITKTGTVSGVSGQGVAAEIQFRVPAAVQNDLPVEFNLTDISAIDPQGQKIILTQVAPKIVVIQNVVPVWPGDTNNDGIVSQADILPIGFYWASQGAARQNASLSWGAQNCTPWTVAMNTYADANGDGQVDQADVMPIGVNWGKTRTAKAAVASNPINNKAILRIKQASDKKEKIIRIDVYLDGFASSLYGMAFTLAKEGACDISTLQPGGVWGDDALFFKQDDEDGIGCAISLKSPQEIPETTELLSLILKPTQPAEDAHITFEQIILCDAEGKTFSIQMADWSIPAEAIQSLIAPESLILSQNYPNPFNPTTRIAYSLPEKSHVSLKIYDCLGREITTLVHTEKEAGNYEVVFDAAGISTGLYYYRLETGGKTLTRKLMVLR